MDVNSSCSTPYQREDPFRPVNWRWRNVSDLLDDGRRPRPERDDPDVLAAANYFRHRRRCNSEHSLIELDREFAGVLDARLFSFASGAKQRFEVKARILAGQDDDAVAAACHLDPATVRWFVSLFFDVRDRLGNRDWVARTVIGLDRMVGANRRHTGRLLMAFGFQGGFRLLEVILAVLRNRRLPDWVVEIAPDDVGFTETRLRLLARLAIATLTAKTPADSHAIRRLHRELLHLHGLRPEDGEPVVRQELAAFLAGELTRSCVEAESLRQTLLIPLDLTLAEKELLRPSSGVG